jgi:hypothetical protein
MMQQMQSTTGMSVWYKDPSLGLRFFLYPIMVLLIAMMYLGRTSLADSQIRSDLSPIVYATSTVPEKLQPQPRSSVGSLYDPGDVGNDEGAVITPGDDAQIGNQGGERVIGDFGPYRGELGNQRRFTHIGKSNDPHVGHEF